MSRLLAIFLVFGVAACGEPDPCAGSHLATRGLVLTSDHVGWARAECFDCHVSARIHQANCLPGGAIDPDGWERVPRDCASCHGNNGLIVDTGEAR